MIELKDISKKYGRVTAIQNINLTINDGEILGLLGQNGAGKTTLMNIITGYINATTGSVVVNGINIDKNPKGVKSQIGYMPEGVPLYGELTVKEFVTYMAELRKLKGEEKKTAVNKALKNAGLVEVQDKLTKNLSKGYKQRTSLAGTLVGNPKIVILDEPTVGLDPKQITEIRELIKELGKSHTVIISSHILSEISQLCDRVVIIKNGIIVADDSPKELERTNTKISQICITIEDNDNKFSKLKINGVIDTKVIETNNNSITYLLSYNDGEDIRKSIFELCSKNDIVILEMKKQESSLEDAFINIINEEGKKK